MYVIDVGGQGQVYAGNSRKKAKRYFAMWVRHLTRRNIRASVTAYSRGVCVKEYDNDLVMTYSTELMES